MAAEELNMEWFLGAITIIGLALSVVAGFVYTIFKSRLRRKRGKRQQAKVFGQIEEFEKRHPLS